MDNAELTRLAALKERIDQLHTLYHVLFGASLVVLALEWFVIGFGPVGRVLWLVSLGGAVAVRAYRTTLVNRYNAEVTGTLE
jgi:hypothetical protein